jgi:hypothetical protein
MAQDVTRRLHHDVIMSIWQMDRVVGTCGMFGRPKEG